MNVQTLNSTINILLIDRRPLFAETLRNALVLEHLVKIDLCLDVSKASRLIKKAELYDVILPGCHHPREYDASFIRELSSLSSSSLALLCDIMPLALSEYILELNLGGIIHTNTELKSFYSAINMIAQGHVYLPVEDVIKESNPVRVKCQLTERV